MRFSRRLKCKSSGIFANNLATSYKENFCFEDKYFRQVSVLMLNQISRDIYVIKYAYFIFIPAFK